MIRLILLGLAAYGAVNLIRRTGTTQPSRPLLAPPKPARPRRRSDANVADADLDAQALRLAEQTDVSPNQAKDLLREHADNADAAAEAKRFKAEG